MQLNITYDRPEDGPGSGPVTVGWFRVHDKAAVLYDPPSRLVSRETAKTHAKSASRCPAVIQMESRYFVVNCPFDLHLGFARDAKGKPVFVNRAGNASPIRNNRINEVMVMVNEAEWRYADRPTIQMALPYVFIADEMVYMTQLGAFAHYRKDPMPGTIFGGRFPINLWPRPLMWAFEWHEPEKDLILRRGEPLFYCQFEGPSPDRPVQVVEAEKTPELASYIEAIGGAVNYVNQTFSLFKAAEELRPKTLLVTKKRG
ncbi:MAG: hypothetical protein ORN49_03320 [Rhodobacteraceae bacterium]|nr:hypothetical protein [Paracoccaceae bacterium]